MASDEAPMLTTEEREEARRLRDNVGPEWQVAFARARTRRFFHDMTLEQNALYQRAKERDNNIAVTKETP